MGVRLMTLTDLYNYYSSQNKTQRFSSAETNDTIVVQVNGKLNFSKDNKTNGLYPVRVQMNFVGDNLNGSSIKMNAQKDALPSAHYRPLLACIHEVEGEPQFYGHNHHMDDNGEVVYDEQPIGVIIEEAHLEYDEDNEKDYAVANGYVWEEYSKASYILERDQRCDVSVELAIEELSYDAKDKVLNLDKFYYSGCTILGCDEEGNKVNPAMPGSNITLADFSSKNNSVISDNLIEVLEKLNTTLSNFNIDILRKEDESVENELEMEVTEETVVENSEEVTETTEDEVTEVEELTETEETPVVVENESTEEENSEEEENEEVIEEEAKCKKKKKCSVTIGDYTREFSISMNQKMEAIRNLVNDTYADDMTFYDVEIFDEDKNVVMVDYWNGKAYRQSYKVKDDVFSLKGDRVQVYSTWMTSDEQKAFDKMKADFEVVSEKLSKYESEPEKMEILESGSYSYVFETEEFKELKDNHFDLSVNEVKEKADAILLDYAKKGSFNFSADKAVTKKQTLPATNRKPAGRYGDLFKS